MDQKRKFLKFLKRQNYQNKKVKLKDSKSRDDNWMCVVCDVPWSSVESGEE